MCEHWNELRNEWAVHWFLKIFESEEVMNDFIAIHWKEHPMQVGQLLLPHFGDHQCLQQRKNLLWETWKTTMLNLFWTICFNFHQSHFRGHLFKWFVDFTECSNHNTRIKFFKVWRQFDDSNPLKWNETRWKMLFSLLWRGNTRIVALSISLAKTVNSWSCKCNQKGNKYFLNQTLSWERVLRNEGGTKLESKLLACFLSWNYS